MKQNFKTETRIQLDPIGQFYASHINEEYPGNYSISAHLEEPINPQILQQAVNDVMRRLPFLSGRLYSDSFWYYHEIISTPPQIKPDYDIAKSTQYYKKGEGHVLRVLYGEYHLKIETIHSICDGRGLTKIIKALLVQYFELLGISVEKNNVINCNDSLHPEEYENAFSKFTDTKIMKLSPEIDAYHHVTSKPSTLRVKTQNFSLSKIKAVAKANGATINGYLLAHLLQSFAEERPIHSSEKSITAMMPVDLRRFFPSQTIRNFVSSATIVMPESENLSEVIQGIQKQLTEIDINFAQNQINTWQEIITGIENLPLAEKISRIQGVLHTLNDQITTTFSNLGLIKLPDPLEEHIKRLEFIIGREPHRPYTFGCISIGDTLTLTATISVEDDKIVENLMKRLEKSI